MKFRKKAVAAVALSAVMACGMLAGCESLTSTNARKDYEQVVATVDITKDAVSGEALGKFGDEYKGYTEAIGTSEITKRDLVSLFASQGGSLVNSGYSYAAVFDSICDSLINRQVYIQYAKAYYLASGEYTVAGYEAAVAAAPAGDANGKEYSAEKKALEKDIAGLGYFLDEEEKAKAEYDLKVSVNEASTITTRPSARPPRASAARTKIFTATITASTRARRATTRSASTRRWRAPRQPRAKRRTPNF